MEPTSPTSAVLWACFQEHAHSAGDRLALSTPEQSLTFAEMSAAAEGLALTLRRAGLGEGSLVGLCLSNSLAFVPACLALCRLDSTVALISPKYGNAELSAILSATRPRCFLIDDTATDGFSRRIAMASSTPVAVRGLPGNLRLVFAELPAEALPSTPTARFAVLKFTSGSTGQPKAIPLTADNLLAEARGVRDTLTLTEADRILVPVPLVHSYGFDLGVLSLVVSGASLAIREGFNPRRALRDLADRTTTVFLGVPSMYGFLLEAQEDAPPPLDHVRYLLSCTAPLAPERIRSFHARFGVPLCQHYGSSETGALANQVPDQVLRRPESVGLPMKHVRVRILDAHGQVLPAGSLGEVVVNGAAVAEGYLMGGPSGPSPFRDGCYWTGDLGKLDADGFLSVSGRSDAMINVGGLKVYPLEVEHVLQSFPAVREAAVAGVPDTSGGQVVFAMVTLNVPASEKDLIAHCRTRLADYKVPRRVEIRTEMPRTATGKIALRAEDFLP